MADVYVTMDLRHLFGGKQENPNEKEATTASDQQDNDNEKASQMDVKDMDFKEWGSELKKRIEANAALDPETRTSEGEIRNRFWKDFFNTKWEAKVADKLLQITLLRRVIEDHGFDPLTNPFLAFIIHPFVQKLVLKGLLNEETFKGINNAVAEKYIADSEFIKENNYNIIYRTDLYRQPSVDIEQYLKCQSTILKPNASKYTKEDIIKNLQTFLVDGIEAAKDPNAKLKELSQIERLTNTQKEQEETGVDRSDLKKIVNELTKSIQLVAALQYINMSTNSKEAKNALQKIKMPNVTGDELIKATSYVAELLNGRRVDKASAETFIDLILDKLKTL